MQTKPRVHPAERTEGLMSWPASRLSLPKTKSDNIDGEVHQDVARDDAAAALNGSAMWGMFLQAEVGPCRVVIESVFLQDAPKMGLAPHDHDLRARA